MPLPSFVGLVLKSVTLSSLINDGTSLTGICDYPDPPYTTSQASSYDRASVKSGNEQWFANRDWGNFVRDETNEGRKEHVLCDVKGPGAMVRYWSPNPAGVTRLYVDGKVVLTAKTVDLLGGRLPAFPAPVSEETSSGWTLHYPVPYQSSFKVTVDDSDNDAAGKMYYQIQYRSYPAGVTVETADLGRGKVMASRLTAVPALKLLAAKDWSGGTLDPGQAIDKKLDGPGAVSQLVVKVPPDDESLPWDDPARLHNVLRAVRVRATFDGEPCADAPLGDLFGTTVGLSRLATLPAQVTGDGLLVLQLPMPYRKSGQLTFENTGPEPVSLQVAASTVPYTWNERSMHFKAQWLCYQGSSRPFRDLNFLDSTGQGVFIGCNVAISNPTPDWWGEGDEKVYVDGEAFPSTFGTGTEDYFGYGWCNPKLFHHAYRFQSRCDGPGNKGHSSIGRWQIIDRMPFQSSFRFDMELWHWKEVDMLYGRTAYWYAKPGGSPPRSDSASSFKIPYIETGIPRVKGAIEGESLEVKVKTGGVTEVQDFGNLSNGRQLWWRDAALGQELTLSVPIAKSGRYRVYARFCVAKDYGIHRLSFGDISTQIDFFDTLKWRTYDLGTTLLKQGLTDLKIRASGANPQAEKRHMFGLDYLLLVPEG